MAQPVSPDPSPSPDMGTLRIPDHAGEEYTTVLTRLHQHLSPKAYFEIGTHAGQSLALARCSSIAIDPTFDISSNVFSNKPCCHLYQMTSDAFFQAYDPRIILGQEIDLAFLDGLHWFETLLRDFMNTEKYCRKNSIIALHDCIPTDVYCGRRDPRSTLWHEAARRPEWWAGDVWKTVWILQRLRPDLKIYALDAPPTGLILITQLNPQEEILSQQYFSITEEMRDLNLADVGIGEFAKRLKLQSTSSFISMSQLRQFFWL